MDNDQKILRYQNNESKVKTYNSFNNQDLNTNKPNIEGNWRSKGLESINYSSNNSTFSRKNFNDYGNQINNRNFNNTYSSFNNNSNYNKYL